jgi:hypothetical protein
MQTSTVMNETAIVMDAIYRAQHEALAAAPARDEVERLREALEWIADLGGDDLADLFHLSATVTIIERLEERARAALASAPVPPVGSRDYQRGVRDGVTEAIQIATEQAKLMADLALEGFEENARVREGMEAALTRFSQKLADTLDGLTPVPPVDEEVESLREALGKMLQAVCGETGFANAVRQVSGLAYPWPALDEAEAKARTALTNDT